MIDWLIDNAVSKNKNDFSSCLKYWTQSLYCFCCYHNILDYLFYNLLHVFNSVRKEKDLFLYKLTMMKYFCSMYHTDFPFIIPCVKWWFHIFYTLWCFLISLLGKEMHISLILMMQIFIYSFIHLFIFIKVFFIIYLEMTRKKQLKFMIDNDFAKV